MMVGVAVGLLLELEGAVEDPGRTIDPASITPAFAYRTLVPFKAV
jgi:hypothetical protein